MNEPHFDQGRCSACGQPAVRGSSGAWWHTGVSCWTMRPFHPDTSSAYFVETEPDDD